MIHGYERGIFSLFRSRWVAYLLVVSSLAALFVLLATTKTSLVPQEDLGTINVNVQCSPGVTLQETIKAINRVEEVIKTIPQVERYSRVAGASARFEASSAAGNFTIRLKNWDKRTGKGDDISSVMEEIYRRTADITTAQIRLSTRPMIAGYGVGSGFELYVQDKKGGTTENLLKYTREFISALNERPEISRSYTTFDTKYPQFIVEVDAAKCKKNGISPQAVLNVLSGYVGGKYASNFNRFTKLYRVMVQAPPEFRTDPESLNNIFVKTSSGEMSPIGQYITLTRVYGSESLSRFNLFPSITVYGEPAFGYSSGQAIAAIQETAGIALPEGYGFEFGGMSREEAEGGNSTGIIFILCIVFIYLILCALYESLMIPLAVILCVPFGLVGSFLFARAWGLENNIYLQIGLVMLIGLIAKTAILLTEYASQRRKAGLSITMSSLFAARARLRPIIMTSLTMIIGMLPLVFAHGVGEKGNMSVGVGAAGGMLAGTVAILFIVPIMFIAFQYVQERFLPGMNHALDEKETNNTEIQ